VRGESVAVALGATFSPFASEFVEQLEVREVASQFSSVLF
jgi:hypothetical protein